MANITIDSIKQRTFDAIVIGSGISGGWAAKEFTERGLKTLVLERGRSVEHIKDYPTANLYPYEQAHRGRVPQSVLEENPILAKCHAFTEDKQQFFVKDNDHPYVQEKPFSWIRGYQTGGRSIMWGRMVQRWSDYDFTGPARDGYAVDWPIRYADIAPWYSHVERFIGVSANRDGIAALPDGEFLPPMELTAVEEHFKKFVEHAYPGRHVINARCAHITGNYEYYIKQGRAGCRFRDQCRRGCPLGGYFSSNASTIPWAAKTGLLTLRNHAVVHSIIYDEIKERAVGVRVVDAVGKEQVDYFAPIIFVNAGSLNTNLILLNSRSNRFPEGLGNDHGVLGKYVAFHNYRAGISAEYDDLADYRTAGRRPNSAYIPRFRNLEKQETSFLRGYAATVGSNRMVVSDKSGVGDALRESLLNPEYGPWRISSGMMGETIPKETSRVSLDQLKRDQWDVPLLKVSMDYDDNDLAMTADYLDQFEEMFTKAGYSNIKRSNTDKIPGLDIHEMGGVRMGYDARTSMLNRWNQLHACPNVFVTDGACMTSTSTQNPSLTYMAITARAVDFAVSELKKKNLAV